MSGYSTLGNQPDLGVDAGSDLSLLDAGIVRLSSELSKPGRANKAKLSTLIDKGELKKGEQGWSAADYNNLACAYFWHDRERGKEKAVCYLREALKQGSPSEEQKQAIEKNLKWFGVSSTEDGKG